MENVNLDDLAIYPKYDQAGMINLFHDFPNQCRQAWEAAAKFRLPEYYAKAENVIIMGMGGSAIGGDLIAGLAVSESDIPIFVTRTYSLPELVCQKSLIITSSYSGDTEETIATFRRALNTAAKLLAITTGGRLEALSIEHQVPMFKFDYRAPPRAALGYSVFPILNFLQRLGILKDKTADVNETFILLDSLQSRWNEQAPAERNLAKQLAAFLYGGTPVIYGAETLAEVAHRWKTQVNENAKSWAFYEVLPEANHNAVVGYPNPPAQAALARVILLDSDSYVDRVKLRYKITRQLLEQSGVAYRDVTAEGQSPLARMMGMVYLGDFVSYYLAILGGIDPTPIKSIDFLKDQLAGA